MPPPPVEKSGNGRCEGDVAILKEVMAAPLGEAGTDLPIGPRIPQKLTEISSGFGRDYFFFSLPIFFAISAISLGFRSARTLSTMFAISVVSSPVECKSSG